MTRYTFKNNKILNNNNNRASVAEWQFMCSLGLKI